jgi:hypothetical protein
MTTIRISNRVQAEFGIVPRAVWFSDLPFAAKAVASYLFCLPPGELPTVAKMESDMGIGREGRRSAFAALLAFGAIEWVIERNRSGAILAKVLVLHGRAFDEVAARSASHATENPSYGEKPQILEESTHTPENPSVGVAAPIATASRSARGGEYVDPKREEKIKRAALARASVRSSRRSAPVRVVAGAAPLALSSFQRSRILSGQSLLLDGVTVKSGSPEMEMLRQALRLQDAGELGGVA